MPVDKWIRFRGYNTRRRSYSQIVLLHRFAIGTTRLADVGESWLSLDRYFYFGRSELYCQLRVLWLAIGWCFRPDICRENMDKIDAEERDDG